MHIKSPQPKTNLNTLMLTRNGGDRDREIFISLEMMVNIVMSLLAIVAGKQRIYTMYFEQKKQQIFFFFSKFQH